MLEHALLADVGRSAQDKLKDLDKEMAKLNDDDTPLTRNIRTLENRLDKAMIKYNEAQVWVPLFFPG